MDLINKTIIIEIAGNCRVTIRSMSKKLGMSPTSIRKRVNKLRDSGFLSRGYVFASLAMYDAEYAYALLTTDATENDETFVEQVGVHPSIASVTRIGPRKLSIAAQIVGSKGLFGLGKFLRGFDCVQDVDVQFMYPMQPSPGPPHHQYLYLGEKVIFTTPQLKILNYLWQDARMPAREIANKANYTPRRVQQIIKSLLNNRGLYFTVLTRWSALGLVPFLIMVEYDEKKVEPHEATKWVQEKDPLSYMNSWQISNQPRLMHFCATKDIKTADSLTSIVKDAPFAKSAECVIYRPQNFFLGPGHTHLGKLVGEDVSNRRADYYTDENAPWY
ncbi:MAG: winged helix-turn-helix transcriptional regulator [Candidatus Thorarchaeota archaeon]